MSKQPNPECRRFYRTINFVSSIIINVMGRVSGKSKVGEEDFPRLGT